MNLVQLKYAVEVERTGSISRAAENLYIGQPTISRAIQELESSLGVTIFKRTSHGVVPTPQGEEFLQYAARILSQVDAVELLYRGGKQEKQKFSISVPRASYIACAFTEFAKSIDTAREAELYYKETNALRAINNILQADYKLGIIRYQTTFEGHFQNMLHEKGLLSEVVTEFSYVATMSRHHPLATRDEIELTDLAPYVEIAHADPFVPSMPSIEARKAELSEFVDKRIFVFERGSQMDLLSNVHNTFMWVSPAPARLLDQYGLVEKRCATNQKVYRDLLIYRRGYRFTDLDRKFIEELWRAKSEILA